MLFLDMRLRWGNPPPAWVECFAWFLVRIGCYYSYEDRSCLSEETLRALLDSPLMERCIGLYLHLTKLPPGWATRLARCRDTSQLMWLNLRGSSVQGADVEEQLSADLPSLVDLDLGTTRLRPEHLQRFAEATAAAAPPELAHVETPAAAVVALANAPRLRQLPRWTCGNAASTTEPYGRWRKGRAWTSSPS